jgi:hypoxanthine phosphoribosyltransferase
MKGGIFTSYSLLQYFTFPLEIDYLQVSRYGSDTQGGELIWKVEPSEPLSGREVLIIDDILDEGVTINKIIEYCKEKGAKSVAAAVLVKKCHGRGTHNSLVRYVALEVPDRYIFGCGMDFKGYFRNLPAIYAINEP